MRECSILCFVASDDKHVRKGLDVHAGMPRGCTRECNTNFIWHRICVKFILRSMVYMDHSINFISVIALSLLHVFGK